MTKGSFSTVTAEVVQKLDKISLISNNSMNEKWEMQTLVKIRKRSFWDFFNFFDRKPKYTILALKLNEIVEEKIHLGSEKSLIVKDFKKTNSDTFRVAVTEKGGEQTDEESLSSLTLWSDSIRQEDLSVLIRGEGLKLVGGIEKKLNLKEGERLAFVTDRVYNTNSVEFKSNTSNPFFAFFDSKSDVSFTVPENTVFAFGLQEVTLDNGSLNIEPEYKIVSETLMSANVVIAGEALRPALPVHVIYTHPIVEIKRKEKTLKPLADVQEATRRSLMKSLTEILEDKEALTLLEDTLDECADDEYKPPQSEAVASFMDLLHKSKMSREMKEALHLLVSALNALPGNLAAQLAKSDPETLNCLMGMMDSLGTDQSKHPESPPPPLQKEGELHLVAEFIMSANDMNELKKKWDNPHITPEALLELLYINVSGLSKMQSK